jgi:holo-[acyl-carrier protein] synthase
LVVGIGIDTVDMDSFRKKLTQELIDELFQPDEIAYCSSQVRFWENFAARFAAKEAAFKALGTGLSSGLRFKEVEIIKCMELGSVSIKLHGNALRAGNEKKVTRLFVSLSHSGRNAIAIVLAESKTV